MYNNLKYSSYSILNSRSQLWLQPAGGRPLSVSMAGMKQLVTLMTRLCGHTKCMQRRSICQIPALVAWP